jgi:hypothetical protein
MKEHQMHQIPKNARHILGARATLTVLLLGWAVFLPTQHLAVGQESQAMAAEADKQKVFKTPEAAVEALLEALRKNDDNALLDIFGRQHKELVVGTDKVAARENRERAYEAAQEFKTLHRQSEGKIVLVIGKNEWPLPIPIVREKSGWRFDTEEGYEEVLNRRIGENELNAIATAGAYVEAQVEYAGEDRDGDEVLEYAQMLGSSKGKRDGLYWEVDPASGEELSPFGPFLANAGDYLDIEDRKPGDPYKGYYFKVLTRQGENSPGGRYDYIINGNMIAGFALITFPADYGSSGVKTFIVNQQGKVYEKDLGEETRFIGNALEVYNPDRTWTEVK